MRWQWGPLYPPKVKRTQASGVGQGREGEGHQSSRLGKRTQASREHPSQCPLPRQNGEARSLGPSPSISWKALICCWVPSRSCRAAASASDTRCSSASAQRPRQCGSPGYDGHCPPHKPARHPLPLQSQLEQPRGCSTAHWGAGNTHKALHSTQAPGVHGWEQVLSPQSGEENPGVQEVEDGGRWGGGREEEREHSPLPGLSRDTRHAGVAPISQE